MGFKQHISRTWQMIEQQVNDVPFRPHNEALGQVKSRKNQYLQGLSGFWKAPKIHLYIKLTSNDAKADAEVEKSHISYLFVYCNKLIRIKGLEETTISQGLFLSKPFCECASRKLPRL